MWSVGLLVLSLVAHTANPTYVSKVEECLDVTYESCDAFLKKVKSAPSASDCRSVNSTAPVCSVLVKKKATWQEANETCAMAGGMLAWVMHKDPELYTAVGGDEFWTGLYQLDYKKQGTDDDREKSYWVYTCPVAGKRGPASNDPSPPDIPWKAVEPNIINQAAAIMTDGGELADEVPRVSKSYVCQAVLRQPTTPVTTSDQEGVGDATTGGSGSAVLIAVLVVVGLALAIAGVVVLVLYLRRKKRTRLSKADMPLILGSPAETPSLSAPQPQSDFSQAANQSPELDANYWSSNRFDLQTITHSKSIVPNDNLAMSSSVPESATFNKLQANVTTPSTGSE